MYNAIIMYHGIYFHCEAPSNIKGGTVMLACAEIDGQPINMRAAKLTRAKKILNSRKAIESLEFARLLNDEYMYPIFVELPYPEEAAEPSDGYM